MDKHAYLIMAHGQFDILKRLVAALDYKWNDIFIHIDKKAGEIDYNGIRACVRESQIYFVDRISVNWGGTSQIKCELNLLKCAARNSYQYYHILSGVDFPIKTQEEIHHFFCTNEGKEFVEFWDKEEKDYAYRVRYYYPLQEKIGRYTYDIRTLFYRLISKLLVFFQWIGKCDRLKVYQGKIKTGSNWISITDDFCQYIIRNETFIYLLFGEGIAVDELFVQTLCWNSEFRERIYTGKPIRLIDWSRGNPYTWDKKDIDEIRNSGSLFVRKVSNQNGLIDVLENDLRKEKNESKN